MLASAYFEGGETKLSTNIFMEATLSGVYHDIMGNSKVVPANQAIKHISGYQVQQGRSCIVVFNTVVHLIVFR